jgi:hypothetical protein
MNQLSHQQLQVHVPIVGWLLIFTNGLFLFIGLCVAALMFTIGFSVNEREALPILLFIGTAMAGFFGVLSLPGLAAGFGLLARQAWARVLAIVVAFLGLLNIPLGTLIGIYAIWVLLQDAANDYFAPGARLPAAPQTPTS